MEEATGADSLDKVKNKEAVIRKWYQPLLFVDFAIAKSRFMR
ncbi:MAG: hypothetical protein AABZ27_04665 [Candidatus Omnitrophota bacterium]